MPSGPHIDYKTNQSTLTTGVSTVGPRLGVAAPTCVHEKTKSMERHLMRAGARSLEFSV